MGSGVPQGGPMASEIFNDCYAKVIQQYIQDSNEADDSLCVQSNISGNNINIGTTAFVDDTCSTLVEKVHSKLPEKSKIDDRLFHNVITPLGVVQNKGKMEFVCRTFGTNSRQTLWDFQEYSKNFRVSARYLGPYLHWNGISSSEISLRIDAARKAWFLFSGFWYTSVDFRLTKIFFKAFVFSVLTSGLCAFVLTSGDLKKLDTFVLNKARRLLRGKACMKEMREDSTTKYVSLSKIQIHREIGIAPMNIELRIMGFKWYQSIVQFPLDHEHFLCAVYGQLKCEEKYPMHPWCLQIENDLRAMQTIDEAAWIYEFIEADTLCFFRKESRISAGACGL